MSNSYVLVNPHIEGSLKTQVKAKNSLEAAKNLYKNLENLEEFKFGLEKEINKTKFEITISENKINQSNDFIKEFYTTRIY